MSTAPGLAFANLTLLLDVPQLPAIFAANCFQNYKTYGRELKVILNGTDDIVYPFNRVNVQDRHTNRMGRARKYCSGPCPLGKPY
uniref:Signal peptide-containing protein n=1 Tax=Babesia bovis TaxID=5865 RepID=S6B9B3_BABBO|nr:signal peptide-containing protein [Babesia bovis]